MSESPDGGHDAVVMLASTVVLVFGAAFGALMVLFVAENSRQATWITIGAIAGCATLIGLLSLDPKKVRKESFWLKLRRWLGFKGPKTEYKARPRVKMKVVTYGTNQPPSVESVRDIKEASDGVRNWSPKSSPHADDHE